MIIVTILITNILTMVNGSFMIWTLSMDPNWQKYCLRFSSPVCHERPPTKSFTEMSRYQTVTVWVWRPGHEEKLSWYVNVASQLTLIRRRLRNDGNSPSEVCCVPTREILLLLVWGVQDGLGVDHDVRASTEPATALTSLRGFTVRFPSQVRSVRCWWCDMISCTASSSLVTVMASVSGQTDISPVRVPGWDINKPVLSFYWNTW